ncbi:MAG: sulfatase-like hydrolase/transferase [Chloroflexi bacterium]|nr:sulfatase-like hydrolase/transferase [Chloroflexota bacterium]
MNVIVLLNDTFRRDHLGCYGNTWIKTPAFDRFAERAAVFEQAYIASYPTIPNRWDHHTGRYGFPIRGWEPLSPGDVTLAQILSQQGYTTYLIYDPPQLGYHNYDYTRGFTAWNWVRGQHADPYITDTDIPTPLPAQRHKLRGVEATKLYLRNQGYCRYERQYKVARIAQTAIDWLETNYNHEKFFLWVDMWDPHEPFDPPWYNHALYADPDYEGDHLIYPQYGRWDYMTPEELRDVRALYAGQVTLVDRWIGYVLDTIEKLGLFENTLVIWTTDHGHLFGEHDLEGKPGGQYGNLYETTTRIPLLIHHPEGVGQGRRVSGIAQPVDTLPTILDAAGVPIPSQVHGRSLLPMMDGKAGSPRRYAFSGRFPAVLAGATRQPGVGHLFDGWVGSDRVVEAITVTDDRWTLIASPLGRPSELYDIAADPQQERNLTDQHPQLAEEMRKALVEFLQERDAGRERLEPFTSGMPHVGVNPGTPMWAFRDDRGRWIAFPGEEQAKAHALSKEGDASRQVTKTTFGKLLDDDPRALVQTHGQYYWAQDLV